MLNDADTVRGSVFALVAMAALALLAGPAATPAAAHAGAYQLTLEASEDCSEEAYCFEVTEGSLDEIPEGGEIQVTLVNPEDNSLDHNVQLAELSDASEDRQTDESAAKAGTEDLSPGEEASFEHFVAQGSSGLYLWCSVGVHESEGMYLEAPLGDGADTSGEETNDSPAAGVLAALAALAAIALIARRDAR